ncbi:DDT domain-containing protein DDR4-like isoform X1 [Cucurbita pepo subsp. pepo]|uniref:DDT domain-containing protein DDR4-like isoform X1 n=1 Tax=Cucurbita pepo subsp. pepo TaxID=3664 RepID=UPI000C9D7354|nr:DDT domain-containing protein DDR4-like isoform X1 [Cucurbita pepo subsp. pepo]XP_023534974.1 DDT domain-containing protein DDR4-like isoform X1 [Cucurbita pepo subsp. pepo]
MADVLPSCRSPAADELSAKEENVDGSAMAVDSDVNFEAEVMKLRGQWELASVLNFLNVFEPLIGKSLRISAEDIEKGLIKPDSSLAELHIVLLKGILPPVGKMLNGSNAWVTVLCKKLAQWWPWVAEGEIPIKAFKGEEISNYKNLDPTKRLLLLKALCQIRADQDDAVSYISDCSKDKTQISCFQKDKFGGDGNGVSYWYDGNPFVGYRLYREVIKSDRKKKGKQNGSVSLPKFSTRWETMATNLEEFHKVKDNLLCSKISSEFAVGRKIESDAIPVLEKLRKNQERSLKRKHRKSMLLNGFKKPCVVGVTRTCRIRAPVNYTFEEYNRAIDDAIGISRNVKKTDEKEEGMMHHKRNRTDVSTSGKSVDACGNSDECSNNDTGSNTTKETDLDSAAHIDKKNYEDNDDRSNDFDSDNFDAEEKNEMLQSKEPAGEVCSRRVDTSRKHHVSNEITKVGAKSRLRQRPVLNSALGN